MIRNNWSQKIHYPSIMKEIFLFLPILFLVDSCKVSDQILTDQVSHSFEKKNTFNVIEKTGASGDIDQLNRIFEKKLVENGFFLTDDNPQLLIQSVIASVNFEREIIGTSGSTSPGGYFGSTPSLHEFKKTGQYGKVIFLIQDAKTNEVLWMGTGTGILTSNEILDSKEIKLALDQLIGGLNKGI